MAKDFWEGGVRITGVVDGILLSYSVTCNSGEELLGRVRIPGVKKLMEILLSNMRFGE